MKKLIISAILLLVTLIFSVTFLSAAEENPHVLDFTSKKNMVTSGGTFYVSVEDMLHGKYEIDGALKLFYEESSRYAPYRAAPRFKGKRPKTTYRYVRVKYRTADKVAATVDFSYGDESYTLVPNTLASGGEWTVSAPVAIAGTVFDRLCAGQHIFLEYTGVDEGSDIEIAEVTFFKSTSEAYSYYGDKETAKSGAKSTLKLAGADIKNYKIVISETAPDTVSEAARALQGYIKTLTGNTLPIVTDRTDPSEHEILLGVSLREGARTPSDKSYDAFFAELKGKTLVISSNIPATLEKAVDTFALTYLYKGLAAPAEINVGEFYFDGRWRALYESITYEEPENVAEPIVFSEDFETDEGYFTEDGGTDN